MKRNNLIYFIVDSARHYSLGGKDDRDKLDMMYEFENDSIFFNNAITSGPSSIMSFLSMMTSMPSYYLARNYDDYRHDKDQLVTLPNLLNKNGYETKSILNAREARMKFETMIPHVKRKYFPAKLSENHFIEGLGHCWPNSKVNEILYSFLKNRHNSDPLFLLVWYQIRLDPNCSEEVEKGINYLKQFGYWDNSEFILSADHGYPDPKRGLTRGKIKELGIPIVSHDLLLFDDNIKIPFYLRYPGFTSQKIEEQISTVDILPTSIELLDLNCPKEDYDKFLGSSLIPLIKRNPDAINLFSNRKLRSDGRFFAQKQRVTSIRSESYKLIVRPDSNEEEFFDLKKDPGEDINSINDTQYLDVINEFRNEYNASENQAIRFQTYYLMNKLQIKLKKKELRKKYYKIMVIGFVEPYYLKIIIRSISDVNKDYKIDLLTTSKSMDHEELHNNSNKVCFLDLDNGINENSLLISRYFKDEKYDYVLALKEIGNTHSIIKYKKVLSKYINYNKFILLNPNMEIESNSPLIKYYNIFMAEKNYWIKNPRMLLYRLVQLLTNKEFFLEKDVTKIKGTI